MKIFFKAKTGRKESLTINIPIPIFGLGCGVLGLSLSKTSINIGKYAEKLLKSLEYRGYDSTGAVFQNEKQEMILLKDVGPPSILTETLGIRDQKGKIFCGQVRWATFGTVTKDNAQPHAVMCKANIYGAHNGNITNTYELKKFLMDEGHKVISNNDGEILVHIIEHYYYVELQKRKLQEFAYSKGKIDDSIVEELKKSMRSAIIKSSSILKGSYAAVIVNPAIEVSYGIKAGSSFYVGVGEVEKRNKYVLVSSDLTAVLKFTKNLIDLKEGMFIEFKSNNYSIFAMKDLTFQKLNRPDLKYAKGEQITSTPVRSKLRAEDTELDPHYNFYMEQEIYAEPESSGRLIKLFQGGSNTANRILEVLTKKGLYPETENLYKLIMDSEEYTNQKNIYESFVESVERNDFFQSVMENYPEIDNELIKEDFDKKYFFSSNKNLFIDLMGVKFSKKRMLLSKALDSFAEKDDYEEFKDKIEQFTELIKNTLEKSRNIYTLSCGTSFNASKIGAQFFNEIAGVEIIPVLPGDFRGQYSQGLQDDDIIIGVSQSGETKDVIDIFNDIDNQDLDIKKIVLVNNMNSTLGQEKSDVSIPILCGPEIAVPATKSFINQITLFFYLAIKTAEIVIEKDDLIANEKQCLVAKQTKITKNLDKYYKFLYDIPHLIKETIDTTKDEIEYVAGKIFMEPSAHILATKLSGVAKEGALKIRETVLNHTEGGEASEFKHGPNTILGKNTVYGIKNVKALLKNLQNIHKEIIQTSKNKEIQLEETEDIVNALYDFIFDRKFPFHLSKKATVVFKEIIRNHNFFDSLYRNYPLIYITGPDQRDVDLTISQINTHKIRGADSFIIAEENQMLMDNASLQPNQNKYYGWGYITLPKTGNTLMTAFSATIVLQLLALKMSTKKMEYLDKLGVDNHGVHPDVPKNVSKSITVD